MQQQWRLQALRPSAQHKVLRGGSVGQDLLKQVQQIELQQINAASGRKDECHGEEAPPVIMPVHVLAACHELPDHAACS